MFGFKITYKSSTWFVSCYRIIFKTWFIQFKSLVYYKWFYIKTNENTFYIIIINVELQLRQGETAELGDNCIVFAININKM